MQAIITRYVPPTNTRGSRVKASCARGKIFVSYPHELSGDAVHEFAANELVKRFCAEDKTKYGTPIESNPWTRKRVMGQIPSGEMVHVFLS